MGTGSGGRLRGDLCPSGLPDRWTCRALASRTGNLRPPGADRGAHPPEATAPSAGTSDAAKHVEHVVLGVSVSRRQRWNRRPAFQPSECTGNGFPELIVPVVRWHLSCFARPEDDGLVFTGPAGALLRRGDFRRWAWLTALKKAELPAVHFHDLRHTGDTLTATAGANLRELMARMGHSSTRAALIYLHSTDERQREIVDALGELAAGELTRRTSRARGTAAGGQSGMRRARRRKSAS